MIDADFYSGAVANNRGKILFVAHWDWVLYNYRLPIARALRDRGLDVVFVCPRGRYVDALQSELGHSRYDTTRRYIHRTLEERVQMVKELD